MSTPMLDHAFAAQQNLLPLNLFDLLTDKKLLQQLRNNLPLLGRIAAGRPLEALAANEQIDLLDLLTNARGQERYALQVQGDSMINEGIWDGDIILCEPRACADNGEIVVALIDEQEATLKRIQLNTDNTVTLWPANPTLTPMIYSANRVRVQGIFVGLLRLKHKLAMEG